MMIGSRGRGQLWKDAQEAAASPSSVTAYSADLIHAARRLASNGLKAWAQVLEHDYEGLVAKDEVSRAPG